MTPATFGNLVIAFIVNLFLGLTQLSAQSKSIDTGEFGEGVVLHSEVLKEDREILIYCPKNSDSTPKACPVVYVLDAENHFNLLVEYSKSLSRWDVGVSPPLMIVK